MTVRIEKLIYKDFEEFYKLYSLTLENDFPGYTKPVIDYFLNKIYTREALINWLSSGWKIVFIAKNQEKILGFAMLDKPYGGVCFCRWLGVLKKARKKGIGKKLINAWLDFSKSYGCHKVEIASQPESREFYEKCNLELEGKRNLSYFGINQYIFGKTIGQPDDEVMTKD
ncbi:hypothetical protein COT75_03110 [Candidatus Beckwithbacteria bacterium CG10_big_fil_rev_8_21_14_0_10_34_10]|uniref:N-acetyltransferase domain-containing protein n=1 Tax=Candidatus Beckwithbacteria bacterium CG10_big_fil_rev_8_21_14_0_10_34_10 TaxID=1974495 RepID=A0A2H0W8Z8_9BACT|nr:MAG: hypothetical protein COT75_03110 [Candidatus Beckwithbacteria bacterium CG10_big_fil_rev_8_21_14_0_10_34_10]